MTLCPCECQMGGGVYSISSNIGDLCAGPCIFLWWYVRDKSLLLSQTHKARCFNERLNGKPTTMYICSSQSRLQEIRPVQDTERPTLRLNRAKKSSNMLQSSRYVCYERTLYFKPAYTEALFCLHSRVSYFNSTQELVCVYCNQRQC